MRMAIFLIALAAWYHAVGGRAWFPSGAHGLLVAAALVFCGLQDALELIERFRAAVNPKGRAGS